MEYTLYDFAGNIGVMLIMVIYLMLQLGKLKSESIYFSTGNVVGAGLIIVSLLQDFNLSAFIVEVFWMIISFVGIVRFFILKGKNI